MTDAILLVGTVDTKGAELGFLRDEVVRAGATALVLDVGVLGAPAFDAGRDRERRGGGGGDVIAALAAGGDENLALQAMARGAARLAADLHRDGDDRRRARDRRHDGDRPRARRDGGAAARRPEADRLERRPLAPDPARARLCRPHDDALGRRPVGAEHGLPGGAPPGGGRRRRRCARGGRRRRLVAARDRRLVARLGVLPVLATLEPALRERGYEHRLPRDRAGGRALEALVAEGRLAAVLDLCLIEVSDHELGSVVSAGERGSRRRGKLGVPQIVAPAGVDAVDFATWRPPPAGSRAGRRTRTTA